MPKQILILYVSSENTLFENHFVGPMIIEVKISDSDIDNLLLNSTEPICQN